MLVLGLDTTGPDCSVVVARGETVLANISERIGRGHAERLGPMVLHAFETASVGAADIERVAVCTGPGSFTGLRVALSFAKGFALPRNRPVIGINRLSLAQSQNPDGLILIDIKRDELAVSDKNDGERILSRENAEGVANNFPGPVVRDPATDMVHLAELAQRVSPDDYPPVAFYGRKPDAKLPGGREPT